MNTISPTQIELKEINQSFIEIFWHRIDQYDIKRFSAENCFDSVILFTAEKNNI